MALVSSVDTIELPHAADRDMELKRDRAIAGLVLKKGITIREANEHILRLLDAIEVQLNTLLEDKVIGK